MHGYRVRVDDGAGAGGAGELAQPVRESVAQVDGRPRHAVPAEQGPDADPRLGAPVAADAVVEVGVGGRRGAPAASDPDLDDCIRRYRRPEPRVRIGTLLGRNRVARAAIDLSDGLADGLRQLARASGAGAVVDADAIPVHPGARRWFAGDGRDPVEAALGGGDDYELLLAAPRRNRRGLRTLARLFRGVPVTRIGELTKAPGLVLRTPDGGRPLPSGYEHFRPTPAAGGPPA